MSMQIQNESNLSLSRQLLDERFDRSHLWAVLLFLGNIPFSIQVLPKQVAAIVPIDNTIDIDHRNHIKNIIF